MSRNFATAQQIEKVRFQDKRFEQKRIKAKLRQIEKQVSEEDIKE